MPSPPGRTSADQAVGAGPVAGDPGGPRPHTMVERSRSEPNLFARQLFDGLPDRYDLLAELLSFGQNARWRREMVDRVVEAAPATVLDVATGTAGVALAVVRRTTAAVTAIDLSESMLIRARERVMGQHRVDRIRLAVAQGEALPFPDGAFDALTFTYLLRYVADPEAVLAELVRVVRPGGLVASLEFHVPHAPWWRAGWWLYTRLALPGLGAMAGRDWFRVGRFLGPSISEHYRRYPLAWAHEAWGRAGMTRVGARVMSLGGGVVMWGTKRDG